MKIILFFLAISSAHAQSTVQLTPVDINNRLEGALDRSAEESRKEQKLTGGEMIAAGGAFAIAGIVGPYIGNDYSTQTAPAVYITMAGLLTVGGIFNLVRENGLASEVKNYHDRPRVTIEDIQTQIDVGQDILRRAAINAERERYWGGGLTVLAGLGNILIAGSSPPSRSSFEAVGYTSLALGYADLTFSARRDTGTALMSLGLANVINDRIDPFSPSSDYLLISGSIVAAAGLARIFVPYQVEREQEHFYNSIKSAEFFLSPSPYGLMAHVQMDF